MTPKLSQEQVAALRASGENELEVVDPDTERAYLIVDIETHRRAMEALRQQQDRIAIAQGIAELDAGEGMPVEEARVLTRQKLLAREP
jgi:hypothetical protein